MHDFLYPPCVRDITIPYTPLRTQPCVLLHTKPYSLLKVAPFCSPNLHPDPHLTNSFKRKNLFDKLTTPNSIILKLYLKFKLNKIAFQCYTYHPLVDRIPAYTGRRGVSQHALGRGVCIPAYIGQGDVCPGGCVPRGCLPRGGVCRGVSAQEVSAQGVSIWGVSAWGYLPKGGV